jgi:hypothetical protein
MFADIGRKPPASPASGARNEMIATISVQVEKWVKSRSRCRLTSIPSGKVREDHDAEQDIERFGYVVGGRNDVAMMNRTVTISNASSA